jgi:hypothetical protein
MIVDKADWQKQKRAHGVPSGVCKDVNMGDAFQAFKDNSPTGTFLSDPAQTLECIEELMPKLMKYMVALKRADPNSTMLPLLQGVAGELSGIKNQCSSKADPMRFVKQYHDESLRKFNQLKADNLNKHKSAHWDVFYRGPLRNVGTQMKKLAESDPSYNVIAAEWKAEMTKVNTWLNQAGVRFQFQQVERTIYKALSRLKLDLVKKGVWPATRGLAQGTAVHTNN